MGRSKGRGKGGGAKAAQAASGTESTKKWSVEEDKMFLKRSKELIEEGNKHFQRAKLEHARQLERQKERFHKAKFDQWARKQAVR